MSNRSFLDLLSRHESARAPSATDALIWCGVLLRKVIQLSRSSLQLALHWSAIGSFASHYTVDAGITRDLARDDVSV